MLIPLLTENEPVTDARKLELSKEWQRLSDLMERAQNEDQPSLAASYEHSLARIETELGDADPREWLE